MNTHRHYDTLASATLSLLAAVVAGTPSVYLNMRALPGSMFLLLASCLIIYFCLYVYRRFDRYAGIALNVSAFIEAGKWRGDRSRTYGFAYVFKHIHDFPQLDSTGGGKIYNRIRFIGFAAIGTYASAFLFLLPTIFGRSWV